MMKTKSTEVTNACLVCYGKKMYYDFSINKFRVEECVACGLMRLNPQPTEHELTAIYDVDHCDATDQSHALKLRADTAKYYINLLASYMGGPLNGRLLEIGYRQGAFFIKSTEHNTSVNNTNRTAHAVDISNNRIESYDKVTYSDVSELLNSSEKFDYIIFTDVLENMRNPRDFLRNVHAILRPNGVLALLTPCLDSFSARVMKNKWVEFKPENFWYFSTVTLRQLLYSEYFGEVKSRLAKKTLSVDYIAQHFEHSPAQPFSSLIKGLRNMLPRFLRQYPFHIVAGEVMMFAKKSPIQSTKKLSVVMAAYNEENTIRKTIEHVLAKQLTNVEIELIIVESNSTDGTQDIIREYAANDRVKIVWQEKPRGKGHAIRAGLEQISGDFILIQDADDEYDLEDYDTLIEPLVSGEAAFVLGARHGGRAWKMRQFNNQRVAGHILNFGHWCFTLLINTLYGLKLKDPFTMYKVFRADCLRGITFECDRFDFDCELLIKLVRHGYRPIEIPVNYRSRSFKEGKKVRAFQDPLTWLKAIFKFRLQKV